MSRGISIRKKKKRRRQSIRSSFSKFRRIVCKSCKSKSVCTCTEWWCQLHRVSFEGESDWSVVIQTFMVEVYKQKPQTIMIHSFVTLKFHLYVNRNRKLWTLLSLRTVTHKSIWTLSHASYDRNKVFFFFKKKLLPLLQVNI